MLVREMGWSVLSDHLVVIVQLDFLCIVMVTAKCVAQVALRLVEGAAPAHCLFWHGVNLAFFLV